jgi:hypothetical protein
MATAVEEFEEFVRDVRPRLLRAFSACRAATVPRMPPAEALAYAWEHWRPETASRVIGVQGGEPGGRVRHAPTQLGRVEDLDVGTEPQQLPGGPVGPFQPQA